MPLDLKAVSPKAGPHFSYNLHAWLRKNFRKDPDKAQAYRHNDELYLGYMFDGDFSGSRLRAILALGTKAQVFCHGGGANPQKSFRLLKTFWPRYQKRGYCYLYPKHNTGFLNQRWKEGARRRTCLWCGVVQRKVTKKRVVVDTSWVNV